MLVPAGWECDFEPINKDWFAEDVQLSELATKIVDPKTRWQTGGLPCGQVCLRVENVCISC